MLSVRGTGNFVQEFGRHSSHPTEFPGFSVGAVDAEMKNIWGKTPKTFPAVNSREFLSPFSV